MSNTDVSYPTDTRAIIDTVRSLTGHEIIEGAGLIGSSFDAGDHSSLPIAVLPDGLRLHSLKPLLEEYRAAPDRIRASAEVTTLESLIAYVQRFKQPESALFAEDTPEQPKLTAWIDYHGQGDCASASFCTHSATYRFPLSEPLQAWIKATERCLDPRKGGMFTQQDFAFFLQDRARDIENPPADWMSVDPETVQEVCALLNLHDDRAPRDEDGNYIDTDSDSPDEEDEDRYIPRTALYKLRKIRFGSAHLLEKLAVGIELSLEMKVEQQFDPKTGRRTINFKDEHETRTSTGRKVTVPDMFFLHIPVFEAGRRHLLPVRLYYRRSGTSLVWGVELVEPARMIRRAVQAAATQAAAATSLPVFFGKPNNR